MECHICMEEYDYTERKPKVLRCGHTFCLQCLWQLQTPRKCPLDSKVFHASPDKLTDNFAVLGTKKPAEPAGLRLWCRSCKKVAVDRCADEHAVCSLKKARGEEAEPLLEALRRRETGLDCLTEVLDAAMRDLESWRAELQQDKAGLVAARGRLQDAKEADDADWDKAKMAAEQDGSSQKAAEMAADLADASATCGLTVRRCGKEWHGKAQPAKDTAARLLLCRLAHLGVLQQQDQPQGKQRPAAPHPNEVDRELTVEEMVAWMEEGCRVGRGADWPPGCADDGTPPGPGTVTGKVGGKVEVKWDRTGATRDYSMGEDTKYPLRLLAPAPLKHLLTIPEMTLDLSRINSDAAMGQMLKGNVTKVRAVVGLDCAASPAGSLKLLQRVAARLEHLVVASPEQRHLDAVLAMPALHFLGIIGVTPAQLKQVGYMITLRTLELHCKVDAPLPVLALPATGLQFLRCGVYPLAAALALVRANADSLEGLLLVAASEQPYGDADLATELRDCGLVNLRWLRLQRVTAYGAFCRHDKASCKRQRDSLRKMFAEEGLDVKVWCSPCQNRLPLSNLY